MYSLWFESIAEVSGMVHCWDGMLLEASIWRLFTRFISAHYFVLEISWLIYHTSLDKTGIKTTIFTIYESILIKCSILENGCLIVETMFHSLSPLLLFYLSVVIFLVVSETQRWGTIPWDNQVKSTADTETSYWPDTQLCHTAATR